MVDFICTVSPDCGPSTCNRTVPSHSRLHGVNLLCTARIRCSRTLGTVWWSDPIGSPPDSGYRTAVFPHHRKPWVPPRDAGRTAFCPRAVQLKYAGAKVNQEASVARAAGTEAHAELNAAVDRRCYIATCAFGDDDRRTWNLRTYRDEVLAKSIAGRVLINLYYMTSPHLVVVAERSPPFRRLVRRSLDLLIGGSPR
mgnify:CR=1 FL=1